MQVPIFKKGEHKLVAAGKGEDFTLPFKNQIYFLLLLNKISGSASLFSLSGPHIFIPRYQVLSKYNFGKLRVNISKWFNNRRIYTACSMDCFNTYECAENKHYLPGPVTTSLEMGKA